MAIYGKHCLIVFAKEPQRGRVKTRLETCLSQSQCLNLYKAFLKDTIETAKKVDCKEKIIAYDSGGKSPLYLKKIAPRYTFYRQKGGRLGERMYNAFRFAKDTGASKMIIIGSDSPALPASPIKKAFSLLDSADVVLGPSLDGGYYLIGLKSPCAGLFKDIAWSSPTVLKDTIKNAQKLKKKAALLDKRYDIDDIRDLFRLKKDLSKIRNKSIARWTRKFMKEHMLDKIVCVRYTYTGRE